MRRPSIWKRKPPLEPAEWPSLQVDEDIDLQVYVWVAERVGWVVMGLLAVAARLGLFSTGPLSRATAEDPEGRLRVEYDRFQRFGGSETLRITLLKPPVSGDRVSLRISRPIVDDLELERNEPEPERTAVAADALVFTFRLLGPQQPGTVLFSLKPQRIGAVSGELGFEGQPPSRLTMFVFP